MIREEPGAMAQAQDFLRDLLSWAPMPAKELVRQAGDAGISPRTLRRAAERLRVRKRKMGMTGGWVWSLPAAEDGQGAPEDVEDAHPQGMGTFEEVGHLRGANGGKLAPSDTRGDDAAPKCPTCGWRLFQIAGEARCPACAARGGAR